jgi:hypothetical protein
VLAVVVLLLHTSGAALRSHVSTVVVAVVHTEMCSMYQYASTVNSAAMRVHHSAYDTISHHMIIELL